MATCANPLYHETYRTSEQPFRISDPRRSCSIHLIDHCGRVIFESKLDKNLQCCTCAMVDIPQRTRGVDNIRVDLSTFSLKLNVKCNKTLLSMLTT